MSKISVNIDQARAILNSIDAAAEAYKAHVKQAHALLEQLQTCWIGPSADAVQEVLSHWILQQSSVGAQIQSASASVRRKLADLESLDQQLADTISEA